MLWAERADAQARASLRQGLWTIRQALKSWPHALISDGDVIRLDPGVMGCDVAQFDKLVQSSDTADWETALAIYRGDLLEGIDLAALAPDGYFLAERNRLRDAALALAERLGATHARATRWVDVLRVSRRGLGVDPYDEGLHARQVLALQELGRQREARDIDQAFANMLKAELGVTIQPSLQPRASAAPYAPASFPAQPMPRSNAPWVLLAVAAAVSLLIVGLGLPASAPAPDAQPRAASTNRIPTANLAAWDQYLRAESQRLSAGTDDALRAVLPAYRTAFTLDPELAAAHAGYALVTLELWLGSLDGPFPSLGARIEAYDAAGRALQIDPGNARALVVLSRIQAQDGALDSALDTARQAVTADGSSVEAHANLALILSHSGRGAEAREALRSMQALPRKRHSEWLRVFGQVAFADGRYDGAIADFAALWPDRPEDTLLLEHLAAALALQGRLRQAATIKDELLAVMPRANLHLVARRYSGQRSATEIARLIEGLRRAGLPDWPYGFSAPESLRLTGKDLAAVVGGPGWVGKSSDGSLFTLRQDADGYFALESASGQFEGRQFVRGDQLCEETEHGTSLGIVCGEVFRAQLGMGGDLALVLVSAHEIRYFSLMK